MPFSKQLALEKLQDSSAVSVSFEAGSEEAGTVNFYIKDHFVLSELFSTSWDSSGIPTQNPNHTNLVAKAAEMKQKQTDTPMYAMVQKLRKSSNRADRELADEYKEINLYGPDSCHTTYNTG
mmetsp:Transcript_66442/g.131736  ORF Transcript_66442/g.131736 Transcript_66442/m.131736 type:complete len:122 (-) Transcript_66442:64-429(-)